MGFKSLVCCALLGVFMVFTASAAPLSANNPVGTWLFTIQFPNAPPFKEIIGLHHRGTVSETNASLNANLSPFSPFVLTASDGYGAWEHGDRGTVRFTFLKMVFCGEGFGPAEAAMGCAFTNQHIGYLRVSAQGHVRGDHFKGGASRTELLIGSDPGTAMVIDLGMAESAAERINVE